MPVVLKKIGQKSNTHLRQWAALAVVLCLSAFLNFFQLQQEGYGNQYYAVAVKSMLLNWHNFFFVSFDPASFVSIDKPPVDLWLQALSVRLFGFSGISLLAPQALAGVLAVALLFHLVSRSFGVLPALLAALVMAITPVGVVISRSNDLDMMLVLVLLLASWAVIRASETGQLRWLLLGALLVGIGFNVKMLQAYLVLPALGLLYGLFAPRKRRVRLAHLGLALLVLLVISFTWITVVDLTPASQRPYVGSSQTNSELELVLNYNGINRLFQPGGGTPPATKHTPRPKPTPTRQPFSGLFALQSLMSMSFAGAQANAANELEIISNPTGSPGPLRLFTGPLGTQGSWLLPLALIGMFALAWQRRWRRPFEEEHRALVLWGTWLLTIVSALSMASHFQSYYTAMMGPALGALLGIGLPLLWRDYSRRPLRDIRGWLLPLALVLTAVFQATLLAVYPGWASWLSPLIIALAGVAAIALTGRRLLKQRRAVLQGVTRFTALLGVLAVLLAPFTWSAVSLAQATSGSFPVAGPVTKDFQGTLVLFNDDLAAHPSAGFTFPQSEQKLLDYLLAQRGKTQFLLATLNTSMAIPFIMQTNQPVMALGGYGGGDPILQTSQLAGDIAHGTVRFFLLPFIVKVVQQNPFEEEFIPTGGHNAVLALWVASHCNSVPAQLWQPGHYVTGPRGQEIFHPSNNLQRSGNVEMTNLLYNCVPAAAG